MLQSPRMVLSKVSIKKIFCVFLANNPNPKTELKYQNNFELLVAVMLSAQSTDKAVNLATPKLFAAANTPHAMCVLGLKQITGFIKTIGLFNTKAKNILLTSQILLTNYNSHIPSSRKQLEGLPGVGVKTAAVVLNVAYKQATIPVDTHVFRVSKRLGLSNTKYPEKTEKELLRVIPKWALSRAHHWLILHGRYICKARKPLCLECPISQYCNYFFRENNASNS